MRPHPWYIRHCSRMEAEERLQEVDPETAQHLQPDGAFILRQSEADGKGFSLSVSRAVKCSISKCFQDEAGKYFFWLSKFDSINQLIDHHRKTSISRNRLLTLVDLVPSKRFPTNVRKFQLDRVIARFDFIAKDVGELSLHRGDVVEVINRDDENWWHGRTSDGRCGLFPSNYVDDLPSVI
ncbi:unnamed protein product [Heterobilharzia americana]|nr:unnamed protein product [Heterobilharzia americana]